MGADEPLGGEKYADFDVSKPNVARVYDAMLGGKDNFAADREFVAEVLRIAPMAPLGAVANRQFLRASRRTSARRQRGRTPASFLHILCG